MPLSTAAIFALAAQCAPAVAPATLVSIAHVESRFDPLAIGVNGTRRVAVQAASLADAVAKASALIAAGRSVDLGLAQINSRNLAWLGLSVEQAFNPCANLGAAGRVLRAAYALSSADQIGEQAALRIALSRYNTGDPSRGFANGYVARVLYAATQFAPAPARSDSSVQDDPTVSAVPLSPAWDVFASARSSVDAFVISLSKPANGEAP